MFKSSILVFAALSLLAGCGGGGSSAPAYSGATTQAAVTTSNAKALSVDAYSGSQLSGAAAGVAKETGSGSGSGQPALLQEAAGIVKQSVGTVVGRQKTTAKSVAATVQNTIYGFSGSFTYSISYNQTTGDFSGTISFSQYMATSTSTTLSGSITFSGNYSPGLYNNQDSGALSGSLTVHLNNLTGTCNSKSFTLNGSMTYSISGTTDTVTMSVVLTDNVSGRTYWVRNFTLTLTGSSLTVSGTYYDPVHGYVIISTVTPLTVSSVDATPTAGQLLFTGFNGTRARLTFSGTGYTLEADTAGNGTYVVVP